MKSSKAMKWLALHSLHPVLAHYDHRRCGSSNAEYSL